MEYSTPESTARRNEMVERQIAARGVAQEEVLEAMRAVPREAFVPAELHEFAYEDSPLPIDKQQTLPQPYIVALMVDALGLGPESRVLEAGTSSGYTTAVLAELAGHVFTIERDPDLAVLAAGRLEMLGYANVLVERGEPSEGWPEHAPFDAILVTRGGSEIDRRLLEQLVPGGRMVIPVGDPPFIQSLVRVTRQSSEEYLTEHLRQIHFVPLIGDESFSERWSRQGTTSAREGEPHELPRLIRETAETFSWPVIPDAELAPLVARIGNARVVLIGEASHGTSEFYRMRARITRALIEHEGFDIIGIEADWPDAARIDHYVRDRRTPAAEWTAFARFPTWMWRNQEVREFVDWLREHNAGRAPADRVGFYGLDLYSMYTSIHEVLRYLDEVDPEAAAVARQRYACLTPWQNDPASYGYAALTGRYRTCEAEAVAMLRDLLDKRIEYEARDGERFLGAAENARLVMDAERYYRMMYYGSHQSWNLRDSHMYQTLRNLLEHHGEGSRAVVWAHNSHIGDARATSMAARGEHNLGQLCRQAFGVAAYNIGFGTHTGTVAAASSWDGPMEIKRVRPSHEQSYERACHDSRAPAFMLRLNLQSRLRQLLWTPRLERAIGVIYLPETEMASHYFEAVLPLQFDEYIWFDETQALTPLATAELHGAPDTYPFAL